MFSQPSKDLTPITTTPKQRGAITSQVPLGGSQARLLPTKSQRSRIQSVVIICRVRKSKTNPNLSPTNPMSKIFISYSHSDEDWKNRLQKKLKILELEGNFTVWDDRQIELGDNWLPTIEHELNLADVAIMLISDDFLTSDFIRTKEIPTLLERREREGVRVVPLIVESCPWQAVGWLSAIQGGSRDNVVLAGLSNHQQNEVLTNLALRIKTIINSNTTQPSSTPKPTNPTTSQTPTILSDRLPTVKGKFFGREQELQLLDDAWHSEKTRVFTQR